VASTGSLIVVGTGIRAPAHATTETIGALRGADVVYYLVADPISEHWVRTMNAATESLMDSYADDKPRLQSYEEMVERILSPVRRGSNVCAAFYGHPGVFVYPSHEAVRRARTEGFDAVMLPAVSAEDLMYADLGIDPAANGCQSYEATDFLIRPRNIDTGTALVLWQVGVIGHSDYQSRGYSTEHLDVLINRLNSLYGGEHLVTLYHGSELPGVEAHVQVTPVKDLAACLITAASTLFVPPRHAAELDVEVIEALEMAPRDNGRGRWAVAGLGPSESVAPR
jgi:Tetrapyrrole (Corrin/Porphyrin) Methylases